MRKLKGGAVHFMDALSDIQRAALLALGRRETHAPKTVLFQKGDEAKGLYVIVSGDVAITLDSPDDKEVLVNIYGAGDTVGEMAVLDEEPRSANGVAQTEVTLVHVPTEKFLDFLRANPDIAIELMRVLTRRLRKTSDVLAESLFLGLEPRLAKRVLELAETYGEPVDGGVRISLPMSQQEIGRVVAFSRESTNKMLGKWQKQGIVDHSEGHLTIFAPARLRALFSGYE
jgi:CRP-like cAMP-binding protein